ncbi:MAG: hypothetical protein Q9227_008369 [Pyrenula ochraceoflavens]
MFSLTRTVLTVAVVLTSTNAASVVSQTKCNSQSYTYDNLAGYGFVPGDAYDQYHDTAGGIGSSIAFDRSSWQKTDAGYTGILWTLPDRGWNTEGTLNFNPRVHKFNVSLIPQPNATTTSPSGTNIQFEYLESILFSGPDGAPTTGLDGNASGHLSYPGFPDLPIATYTGDGFGREGPGGQRIPIDSEGLVLGSDGSFWVSDEYGPYVYHFDSTGRMIEAIRPPDAIIPMRNGVESFSADSPPIYAPNITVSPSDPDTGRENNHGFEGLTASPDGKYLYVMLQAALVQEGGLKGRYERNLRLLQYDISSNAAVYLAEYVVPLPLYYDGSKNTTAAQSEIHFLSPTQFLVLARDSGAGRGQDSSQSLYRHADIFDISSATNIKGPTYDCANCSIASASDGTLKKSITPATVCSFLDFNNNEQLNRFGVHNGGQQDGGLLNEKWESLALVPVDGVDGADRQWFLWSVSDDDFITQNGYMDFGTYEYADSSGYNLDNQVLVFQITLPAGATPL